MSQRIDRRLLEAAVWRGVHADDHGDFDLNPTISSFLDPDQAITPAAVLCPIVERRDGFHVILTKRADHLKRHPGQIAFPGGKVDPEDPSPLGAALREAEEEVGLPREQVDVIGAIEAYVTGTGFRVTPFVGVIHPAFRPITDDGEVAEVFEAPLDFLMNPSNRQMRKGFWRGAERTAYAIPWRGYDIWGATAGMLKALSDRIAAAREEV